MPIDIREISVDDETIYKGLGFKSQELYPNEIVQTQKYRIPFDSIGNGSFVVKKTDYHRKYLFFCGVCYFNEKVDALVKVNVDNRGETDYIPIIKTSEMVLDLGEKATIHIFCPAFANSSRDFLVKLCRGDSPIQIVGAPISTDVAIASMPTQEASWAAGEFKDYLNIPVTFSVATHTVTLISSWKTAGGATPKNQVKKIIIAIVNTNGSDLDYITTPGWNLMYFRFRKSTTPTDFYGECDYRVDNFLGIGSPINNENLILEINNIPLLGNYRVLATIEYYYL